MREEASLQLMGEQEDGKSLVLGEFMGTPIPPGTACQQTSSAGRKPTFPLVLSAFNRLTWDLLSELF